MKNKMFCKICFDSNQSELIYTSHNIKDKKGTVTCPTLKRHICCYCKTMGHYKKYCPKLKYRNKRTIKTQLCAEHEIITTKLDNIYYQLKLIPEHTKSWADIMDIEDYHREIKQLENKLYYIRTNIRNGNKYYNP